MELASCKPSGTCNFVVRSRFFESMWTPVTDDYIPALYSKASTLNNETDGSLKMQVITHENMVSCRTPSPYSQGYKSQNPSNSLPVLIMQCPLQRLIHTEL
jgi:hypothetical protein